MFIKYDKNVVDYSSIFRQAVAQGDGVIELEKGVYHVGNSGVDKAFYSISNNDPFEKSIAFHIKDKDGFTLLGNGATLMFDGFMSGFGIAGSQNVLIKDVNIDYTNNRHFELGIGKVEDGRVRVYRREGFDFEVVDGKVVYNGKPIMRALVMQFDPVLKKPLYRKLYRFFDFAGQKQKSFYTPTKVYYENGELYLENARAHEFVEGSVLMVNIAGRYEQSVFITHSKNVTLENVNIAYSPSMGVVAQLTENVTLKNVCVDINGRHGLLSANCDATHFIQCSGKVKVDGCRFFNMLDDGFNCHGNYTVVQETSKNRIVTKLMHRQQERVNIYFVGDKVKVYDAKTIDEVCTFTVKESRLIANDLVEIITDDAQGVKVGDTLFAYDRMPEVEIINTATGNNRPRGVLITSPKKACVKGCTFSNCEHGIECAGDTSYWFESGGCTDIVIEDCTFDNCNYNDGFYPILFRPVFDKTGINSYYHQNAVIRNNRFRSFTGGMVWARNVRGLSVYDNSMEKSDAYPLDLAPDGVISAEDVLFGKVENNDSFLL
ncbi:MAG: right-handed parallel beta-helix repeat-containing protein [Clostridia bacterium]|nr:right-handed parallel beta-helix repeat-containing protein [Clostridia bacterium]